MNYFGFAISDSMFPAEATIKKTLVSVSSIKNMTPCLNPSHKATIQAMTDRFGIVMPIPEQPPKVFLKPGDTITVMTVWGLPRLVDRHEYTEKEISEATFSFSRYEVLL